MADQSLTTRSAFGADVSRALAHRGKALLEAGDLAAQVQALEPLEAYFIVKELGASDAMPILKFASSEQLQAFVDLDCWCGDRPDPAELDAWLASFAADGLQTLARAFLSLDPELQVLHLAASLEVYEAANEAIPAHDDDVPRLLTSDTYFVLYAIGADARELHPFTLVEALYRADNEEAFRLLTAVLWELPSTLEEMAFNYRNSRLGDMGFPDREVALGIFAEAQLAPLAKVAPPPTALPAVYAQPLQEGSLLTRALHTIQDTALLSQLESGLVYLINAAIIAYGESPRDLTHVALVAARVRDITSLGLEVLLNREAGVAAELAPHAVNEAAGLLARRNVRDLFRVGHHETVELQKAARALVADPVVSQWLTAPTTDRDDYTQDRLDRELLKALTEARPLYGGYEPLRPERRKAFGSRAELHAAETRLDAIANRVS
jgi:hypothetical protein